MSTLLGCIADDFTGATDLAGMLVKAGLRTVQMIGVPDEPLPDNAEAVVIALSPVHARPRMLSAIPSPPAPICRPQGCNKSTSSTAPLSTPPRSAILA